jgi:hypothetical protein
MAFKAVIVSPFMASLAQGHIFSSWDSRTDTSINEVVEIPPSGGSRPVGAFGVATGEVSTQYFGALPVLVARTEKPSYLFLSPEARQKPYVK